LLPTYYKWTTTKTIIIIIIIIITIWPRRTCQVAIGTGGVQHERFRRIRWLYWRSDVWHGKRETRTAAEKTEKRETRNVDVRRVHARVCAFVAAVVKAARDRRRWSVLSVYYYYTTDVLYDSSESTTMMTMMTTMMTMMNNNNTNSNARYATGENRCPRPPSLYTCAALLSTCRRRSTLDSGYWLAPIYLAVSGRVTIQYLIYIYMLHYCGIIIGVYIGIRKGTSTRHLQQLQLTLYNIILYP